MTDPLARVASEEDVLEYSGAFMQLYREEAHYLERTAPGLPVWAPDYMKKHVVEDAESCRLACTRAFLYSQKFVQDDPLETERAAGVDAHEFTKLPELARCLDDMVWKKIGPLANIPVRGARRLCFGQGRQAVAVFRDKVEQVLCPDRRMPAQRKGRCRRASSRATA